MQRLRFALFCGPPVSLPRLVSSSLVSAPLVTSAQRYVGNAAKAKAAIQSKKIDQSGGDQSGEELAAAALKDNTTRRNHGYRKILGGIIRSTAKGNYNTAGSLLGYWLEDYPDELSRLTRSEFNHLKKTISLCGKHDGKISLHTLQVMANVTTRSNNIPWAITFYEKLIRRGVPPSPDTLPFIFKGGNHKHVWNWIRRHDLPLDIPMTLRVLGDAGSWDSALRVARAAEALQRVKGCFAGERYSAGVLIPYLINHGGRWEDAFKVVFRCMKEGSLVDSKLINEVVNASISKVHWAATLALLSSLQRCAFDDSLYQPSLYHRLIDNAPGWEAAIKIHNIARTNFVTPDEHFIAAVLNHCENGNQWQMAARIAEAASVDGTVKEFGPGSFESLIRTYQRAKQWSLAMEAIQWMSSAGHATNEVGFVAMVEMCEVSHHSWEPALRMGQLLLETVSPEHISVATYSSMIKACTWGGLWAQAICLHQRLMNLPSTHISPTAGCHAMTACLNAGKWKEAMSLFQRLRCSQPRIIVPAAGYLLAVQACVQGSQWATASKLLSDMSDRGVRHHGSLVRFLQQMSLESQPQQLTLDRVDADTFLAGRKKARQVFPGGDEGKTPSLPGTPESRVIRRGPKVPRPLAPSTPVVTSKSQ